REPNLADDVAQQVFVRLIFAVQKGNLSRENVRGRLRDVLRKMCRNAVADTLTDLSKRRRIESPWAEPPETAADAWEHDCRAAVFTAAGEVVHDVLQKAMTRGKRGESFRQLLTLIVERADENPENSQTMAAELTKLTGHNWRDDSYRRLLQQIRTRV